MKQIELISIIEEQLFVDFTGKVNIADAKTAQSFGYVIINNGKLIDVLYRGKSGVKAFYNLCLSQMDSGSYKYIVEPEILINPVVNISYPFSTLKSKLESLSAEFKSNSSKKPPSNLSLRVCESIFTEKYEITPQEYSLLCTLLDYNKVEDIYKNCSLLDYEITNSLVELRKKNALIVLRGME